MPSLPADFEETQPIDSPRSVDDGRLIDPHLFGETQALDDPDCDDLGICDWGKTQLVDDDYQDADEGSERTAVLSDGEGLSDDGASHCGGETKVGPEEMVSERKDFLVDLDASADNERCKGIHASSSPTLNGGSYKSNCPPRRNFTSVRAASLRASGLAARVVTPTNPKFSSFDVESSEMQEKHVSRLSCKRVLDFDSSPSAEAYLISHNVQKVEERNETNRSNCTSIKQPFNEVTPEEEEMTGNLCAGLTYAQSQEPGSQSQVNALDFVDNFLLINEIGSSQDVKTDNAHVVKSTPISTAKGTRTLAQRVDLRSPVGKIEIFEWDDRLEDDGGGDFFRRKKELFFEKKDKSQKSQSLPAKSQRCCLGTTEGTKQKVVEKNGPNPKSNFKIGISTSDSKLMLRNSLINDKTHVSIKAKNNLAKDFDEISRAKHLGQQLEATSHDEDVGVHVVGLDTQMAAEAMETLGQNLSISDSKEDAPPFAGIAEKSSNDKVSKVPSRKILHRKGAVNNFENAGRGSKGKRMPCSNVSKRSHPLPRKREKHCLEGQLNTGSLASGNKSSASLKADEQNEVLVGTFTKSDKKCGNPLTLNDRLQVGEELKDYLDFTPIARRTRHFKTVHQRKQDGTLCCAGDTNRLFGGDASRDTERENIPISHIKRLDVDKLQAECNIRSPAKDVFSHPKRRRTCQNISGSGALNNNPNLKNQLSPVNDVLTTAKPLTGQRKRTFIKSVCGIRDLAIQKKRSAFMRKASNFDMMLPNTEKLPRAFGVRTRSSMNSFSFKHHPENNVGECSVESICREARLVDAIHNDSIAATSDRAHNTEATSCAQVDVSISHAKDEGKCAKLEQTPKEKVPLSTLTCTTQLRDADAVSPVCVTQDLPRISSKKGLLMSSLARELSRLDATLASPTQISKDLRRRKDMSKVCVLFSHHLDEDIIKQQKKILTRLGAHMASSMLDATHFVADKFVRTRNMLEAIALGKPVVSHMWLESCGQTSCFIDEKSYILRDLKKEKEIGFIMPVSLARSSQSPLLQGKRVFITPNVKPSRELVVNLVKAAQGLPIERIGRNIKKDGKLPEDLLVLSCEEDYAICIPLLEKGAMVFSSELILNGIVIQKLEYERHRLFLEHVKRTRSTMWLRCEDGSQFIPVTKCS